MSTITIPATDGTYTRRIVTPRNLYHDLAFSLTDVTGGTLTIRGRKNGSTFFEALPDNVIDLSAPHTIQFQGIVVEYEFTLASVTGTATEIAITDNGFKGN